MWKWIGEMNSRFFCSMALGSCFGAHVLTALILLVRGSPKGFWLVVVLYFSLLGMSYLIDYLLGAQR